MPDEDPFQLEDTPEAEWLKAGAEPDLPLPLPPIPGSNESPGVMLFRRVPAGSFLMGRRAVSPAQEPVHRVQVGEFWMGKYVVTQAEWRTVARRMEWATTDPDRINPSYFKGDKLPVEQVSWEDVQAWLASWQAWLDDNPDAVSKLNETAAKFGGKVTVRLPCEAEWEYACRAGSRTDFWNGDGEEALRQVGWFFSNSGHRTHAVDESVSPEEPRHPLGLCGMHGNVWEWCTDVRHRGAYCERPWGWTARAWEDGDDADWGRALRGGGWLGNGGSAASGNRNGGDPGDRFNYVGFRPCLFLSVVRQPEWRDGHAPEAEPAHPAKYSAEASVLRERSCVAHWPNREAVGFWDWDKLRGDGVTKLVIQGPLKLNEAEVLQLTRGIAALDTLRELYLWSIRDAFSLPVLPSSLRILNLGGCKGLETLGSLPPELQVLDLAGCEKLASFGHLGGPGLRSLFLNGCPGLRSSQLQGILDRSPHLEELDANECQQVIEIERIPPELRRLMLSHCSGLVRLPDLSAHTALTDLDIRHCTSLTTLPGLPIRQGEGLRRLLAHECDSLREFRGFDVRPVHLGELRTSVVNGSATSSNVAATFRTMQRLAGAASDLVMGKVLFLGGGRCGKTTLAKALQWEEMDEKGRGKNPKLNPMEYSESTHGIHFWRWQTRFGGAVQRPGEAHLWDFGGQEVYHNTHRMFASEGSVFVIATTSRARHEERWKQDVENGAKPEERPRWNEQNEFREVRYWLDYLRSVLEIGSVDAFAQRLRSEAGHRRVFVRIVYTGKASHEEARQELMAQAGPYRDLLERDEGGLRWGVFDREQTGGPAGTVKPILQWVQDSLGHAADAFGIRTPALFKKMAERVGVEIERDIQPQPSDEDSGVARQLMPLEEWQGWVEDAAPVEGAEEVRRMLRAEQAKATAEYLHQCGRVFWLGKETPTSSIILNHQWAADILYALVEPKHVEKWRKQAGTLMREDSLRRVLLQVRPYKECNPEQRDRLLDLLHDCGVCVRVGWEEWLPMQAELLPRQTAAFDEDLVRKWESVRQTRPGLWVNHSFAIHAKNGRLLGHVDFRAVVRALVEGRSRGLPRALFGKNEDEPGEALAQSTVTHAHAPIRLWETGLQLELNSPGTTVQEHGVAVVRVEWMATQGADGQRQFGGGIFVQLLTRDEDRQGERLRKFLRDGPLRAFGGELDDASDLRPKDLPRADMGSLRGHGQPGWTTLHGPPRPDVQHDVAISYRWRDWEIVEPLVEALNQAGIRFYFDQQDQRLDEADRGSRITEIYDYLRRARVLIVVASEKYFETPDWKTRTNLYCPVELADAVNAWAGHDSSGHESRSGHTLTRPAGNFLWVLAPGFDPSALRGRAQKMMTEYQANVIGARAPMRWQTPGLSEWDKREMASIDGATVERMNSFETCVVGTPAQVVSAETDGWASAMVEKVRRLVGTGRVS